MSKNSNSHQFLFEGRKPAPGGGPHHRAHAQVKYVTAASLQIGRTRILFLYYRKTKIVAAEEPVGAEGVVAPVARALLLGARSLLPPAGPLYW